MGRRRTIGQARSAGSGRACKHPRRALEVQYGDGPNRPHVIRCKRCGQYLTHVSEP